MNYITSAPKGASKCNFRPCEAIMTDDPTNQSTNPTTDQRALLSIGKFPKTIFHRVVSHWRITQISPVRVGGGDGMELGGGADGLNLRWADASHLLVLIIKHRK